MAGYRVPKQPEGTRVSWWVDPRGPNHGQHAWGTIIQHTGDNIFLVWDDDDEFYEIWSAAEVRYRIDRGQMRLKQPRKERRQRLPKDQLTCKTCGRPRQLKCGCPRPGAPKPEEWGQQSQKYVAKLLTSSPESDTIASSIKGQGDDPRTFNKERGTMARKTTKQVEAIEDEVEELEELDDAVEVADADDDGGDLLSAKEAAARIGTDARTLRKFLRKKNGLVGQGNRWAIDVNDVDALKAEFNAWAKGNKAAADEKKAKAKVTAPPADDDDAFSEIDDDDLEELEV
jgi:hypothetical protein